MKTPVFLWHIRISREPTADHRCTFVMTSLLITLCTYNERQNIELMIPELLAVAPDATVLIIDDNSPDGTGQVADQLASKDARIRVLHRAEKLGLGAATVAGFQYGVQNAFDYLINLDADFSHQPRYVPALRDQMTEFDVAIGSRYIAGGGVVGWTIKRHVMSQTINFLARLLLRLKTRDNSGSFRCYRVSRLAEIDWNKTISKGYAFQEEVLYHCRLLGCRFVEIPIMFEDRRFGKTKINWKESLRAVRDLVRLSIGSLWR